MMNGEQREQLHAATVSHLKDKLLRKYDSMENLNKIGQNHSTFNDSIPNKVPSPGNNDLNTVNPSQIPTYQIPPMLTANAMTGVNQIPGNVVPAGMYQPAMPLHPAFVRATYSSVQTLNALPTGYNQPLASMQQMAQFYGSAGSGQFPQKKPDSEGQPLNLCRPPTTNGTREAEFLSFEQILDQKIKEEISS
ncbi:hypothetical protein KUTeg_002594 [Tegillarca granosa]|uniref:Uncharacterized protein n=1 Tax=Tegillarca granosa TaxID=220873 RepID=A0ABQ9FUR0_TEGGR|nr:hypothetical protein KUTeg_002594 [Tegillarca granosa]